MPPGQDDLSDDALALITHYGDLLATLSHLEDDASSSSTEASDLTNHEADTVSASDEDPRR